MVAASPLVRVCTLLLASASRCRMYGQAHRLTQEALEQLHAELGALLAENRHVRLKVSGSEVLFEGDALDDTSGQAEALVRRLGAKGIGMLEISRGLTREELESFCSHLADPAAGSIQSQTHLLVGTADVPLDQLGMPQELLRVRNLAGTRSDPVSEETREVARLSQHVREHYEVRARDFQEVALALLGQISQRMNLFSALAEVRDHNLFTYLHTCNVATLSMGFAAAVGLQGKAAADLGTAALLHDVGKNFVPSEILDKPGKLDPAEWEVIRRHPEDGARLLLKQPDVSRLSVVVAYEHHMHFDGVGGYPSSPYPPSLQSQLIAIADTFDALFGRRSYHVRYDVLQALEVLQSDAGRVYNPELVDEFSRFVIGQMEQVAWGPDGRRA